MRKNVIVDGRIFSLQQKGGISQFWARILGSAAWSGNVRTTLFVYPGFDENIHLADLMSAMRRNRVAMILSDIPPSDHEKFCSDDSMSKRRGLLEAGVPFDTDFVVNTYYGENVFPACSKYLVVAHDFAHEEVETLRTKPTTASVLQMKAAAFRLATHICFVSNATRIAFFRHFPLFLKKQTSVIYHGHDVDRQPALKSRNVIVHVGTRGGYKDFPTVAAAMAQVFAANPFARLLVMGGEPADEHVMELRRTFPGRVAFRHCPTDREMNLAMAVASVFVSASRYEGFGIPVLNALRCRTIPVLSDIPVHREVAGDRGIYFCPGETGGLAMAVLEAMKAPAPAVPFSRPWEAVAMEYCRVLGDV